MGNCHVVGPDEVMVVSGGCTNRKQIVIGGCAWACYGITNVQRLSLNVMTLEPQCQSVETKQGVALHVNAVAQVKVIAEDYMAEGNGDPAKPDAFLTKALEQFLGKTKQEIQRTILQTLEGHLRAILGTLTVEEIYNEREMFAQLVRETASTDVAKMGLEILSFTIKDVTDEVKYLDSLGIAKTEDVKREAAIGKAEAQRDSDIKEAQCFKTAQEVVYETKSQIENAKRAFQTTAAGYAEEVNKKKAEAELAYQLQSARLQQQITAEKMEIEVIVRHRQIEVEEQEVLRREKELLATVHRPAEAERYKAETLAEGKRTQAVLKAQGEAEGIKLIGAAEAASIRAIGEAEALAMKAKAQAYKNYGEAAVMSLILEALPKIAAEVAAPLGQVKEIVVLGNSGDSMTNEITKLVGSLPPAVQALTGVDITNALKNLAGGSTA